MTDKFRKYRFWFLVFSVLVWLPSCLPEQKLAKSFIQSRQVFNLMVTSPGIVHKFNHKGETIKEFSSMDSLERERALWYGSQFIRYVSDSILLENYMNAFIDELRLLGMNVFLETTADSFNTSHPQSYMVNLAQIQLDEYIYPLQDEVEYYDSVYVKNININAVDFSCWIDLNKAGIPNPRTTVLYATSTAYDAFDGRFYADPFSGQVRYRYSIDTLKAGELHELSSMLGKKHAGFLYDFFMNQYIGHHLPDGYDPLDYYHYNRKRDALVPAYEDRFEVLGTR